MTYRNPQLHRIAAGELLGHDRLARESGCVATEVRDFIRLWNNGHDLDQLRADILPGRESSDWNRKFQMRVLAQFERMVRNTQSAEDAA